MSVLGNKRSGGGGGSLSREQCHQGDDRNEGAAADADDLLTMMRFRAIQILEYQTNMRRCRFDIV